MSVKVLKGENLTWINIEEPNEEVIGYLKANFRFHPLDFEDVLGRSQRPKMDIYQNYLFLVFHFPELEKEAKQIIAHELYVFLGRHYLITIQKKKFKALTNYFYRRLKEIKVQKKTSGKADIRNTPGFLLYKVLEILFRSSFPIIDLLGRNIKEVEGEIYEEKTKTAVKNLANLRRDILNMRKIIDPQRYIMNALAHLKKEFLPKELSVYFDNIRDLLENIWVILENYRDMLTGLHDTNESLISHHTNEVIKILTIISVSLLPLTVVSGIYGMNITGLPLAESPKAVWSIFIFVFLLIILALYILRKKDWL